MVSKTSYITTTDTCLSIISPIEEVIEDARCGKMFILVDDEDRENECDLVMCSQDVKPDDINFMATHGRGLICLTITQKKYENLGLVMQTKNNTENFSTAFTVSIEARYNVTTGISAKDRYTTIQAAINESATGADIATPGHMFPIVGKEGGVLTRQGHTEASIDIAKLAGKIPSGVICEIMNDDGSMARLCDMKEYIKKFDLKIGTIVDLKRYIEENGK